MGLEEIETMIEIAQIIVALLAVIIVVVSLCHVAKDLIEDFRGD